VTTVMDDSDDVSEGQESHVPSLSLLCWLHKDMYVPRTRLPIASDSNKKLLETTAQYLSIYQAICLVCLGVVLVVMILTAHC
jgi:hypothetical protein